MKKITCDRCGKDVPEDDWKKVIIRDVTTATERTFDCCKNCAINFDPTINMRITTKTESDIPMIRFKWSTDFIKYLCKDITCTEIKKKFLPKYRKILKSGGKSDDAFLITSHKIFVKLMLKTEFIGSDRYTTDELSSMLAGEKGHIQIYIEHEGEFETSYKCHIILGDDSLFPSDALNDVSILIIPMPTNSLIECPELLVLPVEIIA